MKQYHYGRQAIEPADVRAVIEALESDFLSQGPRLQEFEEKVAAYCQARYCLAVSSGTAALHLACLALCVGNDEGDTGWTSPLSFVASANCIRYCGAIPDFIDIHPGTLNMDVDLLEQALARSRQNGTLPKVLIPVHFAGLSCDMRRIQGLAQEYGVRVIEDACHALGGSYDGKPIGCCDYSDIAVFSLHPVKSITSGEGGLILTNDVGLYKTMKAMRSHGLAKGEELRPGTPPYHVEMIQEGFNYKISEIQCALGISQMDKLDEYVKKRRILARHYEKRLKDITVIAFQDCGERFDSSAWHLMIALFDFEKLELEKADFYHGLQKQGVNLMVHYCPIHLHAYYRNLGHSEGMFPNAENYYDKAFSLPLHPGLEIDDIDIICDRVLESVCFK